MIDQIMLVFILKLMKRNIQNNEQGIAHLVPIVAVLVLVAIGGIGYRVYTQSSKSKASIATTQSAEKKVLLASDLSSIKSLSDIQAQAESQLNGASVRGVELESDEGVLVYKLALSDGRVLKFNAVTGASAGTSKDDSQNADNVASITIAADLIGFAKAREVAVAEMPGKDVSKIELETEDGVLVYSVRFSDNSRVDVHAKTAAVVHAKAAQAKSESSSSSTSSSSGSGSSRTSTGSGSSGGGHGTSSPIADDNDDSSPSSSTPTPSATATSASISESQARTIANGRLPGRTIEKVESDTEDGVAVFSVRYTDDGRVDVRKSDGVIVRVKE